MELYANPNRQDHLENNDTFRRAVSDYLWLKLFQPSPVKAPWHWQAIIPGTHCDQLINFWPHTMKAQRDGFPSVQGEDAVREAIERALEDAHEERFDVIEN